MWRGTTRISYQKLCELTRKPTPNRKQESLEPARTEHARIIRPVPMSELPPGVVAHLTPESNVVRVTRGAWRKRTDLLTSQLLALRAPEVFLPEEQ